MKSIKGQTLLIKAALISIFFDAYCLTYIGNYPVTLFTIVGVVFIVYTLIYASRKFQIGTDKPTIILLLFALYIIINFFVCSGSVFLSLLQSMFFCAVFLSFKRKTTVSEFEHTIDFFRKWMHFFTIYGLYQFLARSMNLPFADLVIQDHMVNGYNRTNVVSILGTSFYRSNAIFREPSFFGQFLAICILLGLVDLIYDRNGERTNKKTRRKAITWLILYSVTFLTTFSGTGFIILVFGLLIFLMLVAKDKKTMRRIIGILFVTIVSALIIVLFTPVGKYLMGRTQELFVYDMDHSAGYARFRAWTDMLNGDWRRNPLMGIGIGGSKESFGSMVTKYYGFTFNGFSKMVVECGILGATLFCGFIASFLFKARKSYSMYYIMIATVMTPMLFCHEATTSNIFWFFAGLLNCRIASPKSTSFLDRNR